MENEKVYTMEDFKKQQKKMEKKAKREAKLREIENWFYNNKELAMVLIPIGGTVAVAGTKGLFKLGNGIVRKHNLKKEEALKNLYCYDRSLGHYWALRRELSNQEWLEIERRRKLGERLSDILAQMGVLK